MFYSNGLLSLHALLKLAFICNPRMYHISVTRDLLNMVYFCSHKLSTNFWAVLQLWFTTYYILVSTDQLLVLYFSNLMSHTSGLQKGSLFSLIKGHVSNTLFHCISCAHFPKFHDQKFGRVIYMRIYENGVSWKILLSTWPTCESEIFLP
jgi:hypothetical protein